MEGLEATQSQELKCSRAEFGAVLGRKVITSYYFDRIW